MTRHIDIRNFFDTISLEKTWEIINDYIKEESRYIVIYQHISEKRGKEYPILTNRRYTKKTESNKISSYTTSIFELEKKYDDIKIDLERSRSAAQIYNDIIQNIEKQFVCFRKLLHESYLHYNKYFHSSFLSGFLHIPAFAAAALHNGLTAPPAYVSILRTCEPSEIWKTALHPPAFSVPGMPTCHVPCGP